MSSTDLEQGLSALSLSPTALDTPASTFAPLPLRASFSHLPPELKLEIALHVRDDDEAEPQVEDDESASYETDSEDEEDEPSLPALALVNREMSEICRPILWEDIDLGDRSLHSLCTFLLCIVPSCGHLIKGLAWDHDSILQASWSWEYGVSAAHFFPDEKPVVKHAEWLTGVDLNLSIFDRRLRAPGLFIALILQWCPNLSWLDFTAFNRYTTFKEHADMATQWIDHAFEAVLQVAPLEQITHLVLRLEVDWRAANEDLPRLFGAMPHLVSRLLLLCPLSNLSLCGNPTIPLDDFAALVNSLSRTLVSLECGDVKRSSSGDGSAEEKPPGVAASATRVESFDLPFLQDLTFYHQLPTEPILPLFLESPISTFTLLGMCKERRHEALSFISALATKKTLRRIEVQDDGYGSEDFISFNLRGKGEVNEVKDVCRAVGVECEVVEESLDLYEEEEWLPRRRASKWDPVL
ncbi:hypothetical protein JCM6882_003181 [Rhodosporidiobolus microsporus]